MQTVLVKEKMTSPVLTARPEAKVNVLVAMLRLRGVSAVPIVASNRLLGIVSTTDLLCADATATAGELMSSPVVTARPDELLADAAYRLGAAGVHRLVVAEPSEPAAGILSARDVLDELRIASAPTSASDPIRRYMSTELHGVDIGDSIAVATERLAQANVHGLVVMDGSAPVGVFTHAEALAARQLPSALRDGPVEDVMSYETVCLDGTTPVRRAAAYMAAMNVRRILVVDRRRLVGIVSAVDLVRVLAASSEVESPRSATSMRH